MERDPRFTHKTLVEKCKNGHRSSQYELYSLYVDAMYNVSIRMLGNIEDAEDVVQDSFVLAFKNLTNFKYESSFGAWLKRIVINKSINHLKAKKITLVPIDTHHIPFNDTYEEEEEKVDIVKVKRGIEKLPHGYKQIISLYLIDGYDHVEISEILNISTSTSKSQYHRAKKSLIDIIHKM